MTETELLAQLSELAGILPEYIDNWQQKNSPSIATQRAILTAMGLDISTKKSIEAAIKNYQLRPWRSVLEPVRVLRNSSHWVRLTLPESFTQAEFSWQLQLEDGTEQRHSFQPNQLLQLERKTVDGIAYCAWKLILPVSISLGYHRLAILSNEIVLAEQSLIMTPEKCYQPGALNESGKVWGPAVQLYAVRSERNWGMGDFTDLRLLLEQWSIWGADIIGINPLHALFPHNPEHASPYSPSSRLFFNPLYLDVEAIEDFRDCERARSLLGTAEFQLRLEGLRETELVDYKAVSAIKMPMLEMLYSHFREQHIEPNTQRAVAFRNFQQKEGERLYHQALFETLQEYFHQQDNRVWGWPVWPEPYRQLQTPEVQAFAAENRERIEFFCYLQWQASVQIGAVGWRSMELGMGVGIYLDLAVSVDGGGGESWANQALYAIGVGIGAPPEMGNQIGQDWGLPPMVPSRLFEAAYLPFIATLQHNMRFAGALRLDHVMGLMRQFWVPAGTSPTEGAYVSYPLTDLLGILALESQRNQCMVIGEDLGTVPEAVRTALAPMDVLSYRLLIDTHTADGSLQPPIEYPAQALAGISTHDMPTLAGFWEGRDILRRTELQLFSSEEARQAQIIDRARARTELLLMLEKDDLLPEGVTVNAVSLPAVTPEFSEAVYMYLARCPSKLLMVQLEDVFGVLEQINIPTTTTQHANWRLKLPHNLESWASDSRPQSLSAALRNERPRRQLPAPRQLASIPLSTYRLQFNRDFTFQQATQLVPYLAQLGVSHVYCSPYLKARAGSSHGYDIIDHKSLNPEIGSSEDFDAFCNSLKAYGMGQILDMVPNHMGIMGADNEWWLDVLEHGQASIYADFFDIDWQPMKVELHGKVLLPILAKRYGIALEDGDFKLAFDESSGSFSIWYYQHRLPLDPGEYPRLLQHRYELLATHLQPENPDQQELASLITAFEKLPSNLASSREKMLERHRDSALLKRRLATLAGNCPEVMTMLQDTVKDFTGTPGEFASFRALHELLEVQAWRLADWHVASDEINYRRFFDINDLAALRMEDSSVFEMTHQLVFDLIANGRVNGLRIDHPDGLYDPAQYFERLQERSSLNAVDGSKFYIVVEKILAFAEPLRDDWAVQGSSGYDFCNLLSRLLVDPQGEDILNKSYHHFIGEKGDFKRLVYEAKQQIMEHAMASEINVLAGQLSRICESSPHTRDYTYNNFRTALIEVIANFPVYRTYVRQDQVDSLDRRYVEWAVALAKKANRKRDVTIFDLIATILLLDDIAGKEEDEQSAVVAFAMKFQQVSSPVMAKGFEDTALYQYHRLISLNEVGSDPSNFSVTLAEFHAENSQRLARWPHSMLNTSTHDSKRSEDVRMRINVLSEIPAVWQQQSRRWKTINQHRKIPLDQCMAPSRNDEYLLYQTLIGVWPLKDMDDAAYEIFVARIEAYMLKAVRESKQHTSWINPVPEYEQALCSFIRLLLHHGDSNIFLNEFLPFQRSVARWGMFNSLSQTLIKLTAPGVPDLYQGNELWTFDLVDPDNRRPVDYSLRQQMLEELKEHVVVSQPELGRRVRQLLDDMTDGRAKLYLTWRVLNVRKHWQPVFQDGDYTPLEVTGPAAQHLCVFARRSGTERVITITPRWYSRLSPNTDDFPLGANVWGDTFIEVPELTLGDSGINLLTGEAVKVISQNELTVLPVATLLGLFPVALVKFTALIA